MISSDTCSVLIDPYFSNALASQGFIRLYDSPVPKGYLNVNYVLSTHDHDDHLDIETLRDFISFEKVYGPDSCVARLESAGFSKEKISGFNRGDTINLDGMKFNAVYAEHTPDSIGIIANCEDIKLYFTGDCSMNEKLNANGKHNPDILITCINGKFGNMTWQEAVVLAHILKVKTVIPAHYDLFAINMEDPVPFSEAFRNSPIQCLILDRCKPYDIQMLLNK